MYNGVVSRRFVVIYRNQARHTLVRICKRHITGNIKYQHLLGLAIGYLIAHS